MKDFIINLFAIIVGLIIGLLLCHKSIPEQKIITHVDTVIVHDTISKIDTVHSISYKTIKTVLPGKIDTVFVLGDYYSVKQYTDTFNCKYGEIIIMDTITRNSIKNRLYKSHIIVPTKEITIKQETSVILNGWSIGGGYGKTFIGLPVYYIQGGYTFCRFTFQGSLSNRDVRIGLSYKL
jgi:hypothetical protein